jgi:acyl-CoA thioester hydrolase
MPSREFQPSSAIANPERPLQESPEKPPRPPLPRLEDFPIRASDTIRFADLDRQGHVNNAVYPTYFESGRVPRIYDPKEGFQVDGCTTVLARIEIDFLKELRWPGTVEIGTAIAEIRRSSYVFAQVIFNEGACAARARSTMVLIDRATRKARPLPPDLVARLEGLMLKAS